jgi:chitin disaccharide deacetylase
MLAHPRTLLVIADDFGIGPETDRGILDCAQRGLLSGTVLLVNSPYAAAAVDSWRSLGRPVEIGWHPNLTLDVPILGSRVPSLVGKAGTFERLGVFLRKLLSGRVVHAEIEAELRAQRDRFIELVGHPPTFVNAHQHVALFPPVGRILLDILAEQTPRPLVRRVCEPPAVLRKVPGARTKRLVLHTLGKRFARLQAAGGFPGPSWLLGITDPAWVTDREYFPRWLRATDVADAELMVHPGYEDATLLGRDAEPGSGLIQRRVDELDRLFEPTFRAALRETGFQILRPSERLESTRRAA